MQDVPDEASSPATRQAAHASSSSASGPAAAPSSATGQAARTQRQSASAPASQAPATHAGMVPVVAIGNAIVQCAKAVRDAGLMGVEEAADAGELPKWNEVPKDCGFKIPTAWWARPSTLCHEAGADSAVSGIWAVQELGAQSVRSGGRGV